MSSVRPTAWVPFFVLSQECHDARLGLVCVGLVDSAEAEFPDIRPLLARLPVVRTVPSLREVVGMEHEVAHAVIDVEISFRDTAGDDAEDVIVFLRRSEDVGNIDDDFVDMESHLRRVAALSVFDFQADDYAVGFGVGIPFKDGSRTGVHHAVEVPIAVCVVALGLVLRHEVQVVEGEGCRVDLDDGFGHDDLVEGDGVGGRTEGSLVVVGIEDVFCGDAG